MEGDFQVEVKDLDIIAWFEAELIDMDKGKFLIRYDYSGHEEWVETERIRWRAPEHDVDLITYQEGNLVEVKAAVERGQPCGWFEAKIRTIKNGLYFVHYEEYDSKLDEIVSKDRLRPLNTLSGPETWDYSLTEIKIPSSFQFPSEFDPPQIKFREKVGILALEFINANVILLKGIPASVHRAELMIELMIQHHKTLSKY